MKKILIILVLFFSSSVFAEKILLECKCEEVYFYETTRFGSCFQSDNIIEIDLKNWTIDYLDNDGKEMVERVLNDIEGIIEITEINSSQIIYIIAFNVAGKDVLRTNTLNRYNGVLDTKVYFNNLQGIDITSICKKADALF